MIGTGMTSNASAAKSLSTLFPREQVVGIFRGFSEGGLEFHADLVLPYRSEFHRIPMHGQFMLVQLENDHEGVLGRITAMASEGRLVSSSGEEYGLRALADDRDIPEDLRERYLRYRVNIRVLGVLRLVHGRPVFAPSHRRLPHVGSRVAFLSDELLRYAVGHYGEGVELGFFALGEFIYSGGDGRLDEADWMRVQPAAVVPRFDVQQLVARRTLVFARAGFGKSNLNKLLFSSLYRQTPTVQKRGGRRIPVGTVIFDPDGEYFWPDDKGRPGLCDVPELAEHLVVFTNRQPPSAYYGSFIASGIKLDLRRLRAADVLAIALPPERQDQQNVRKLKGLNDSDWQRLVTAIHEEGNSTDLTLIKQILKLEQDQDAEALAARANMTAIVRMLHDPTSQMMDMLLAALRAGKLCVVDVSQLRGTPALILSGLILQKIFDTNQEEFTKAEPQTIPTIAVVEEAQAVLGSSGSSGEGPYVTWVKEGRKYDLGAVLITQQPGSIPQEILSQGDNWFIFHLLSAGDLQAVKRANAHFSDDLLSSLLNEPIPGQGVFWSSAGSTPYPIPVRVLSFERMYRQRDPDGTLGAAETFATRLRAKFARALEERQERVLQGDATATASTRNGVPASPGQAGITGGRSAANVQPAADGVAETAERYLTEQQSDYLETFVTDAIRQLQQDDYFMDEVRRGIPWGGIVRRLQKALPADVLDPSELERIAYNAVRRFLIETFGPEGTGWHTERRPSRSRSSTWTTWVFVGRKPDTAG